MQRRTVLLLVLASMVVSSLITWGASTQIRSPAEAAARTAAPEPTPILVEVEEKTLATKVLTRGTGHYRTPQQLSVVHSLLKSAAQIVTKLPKVGAPVDEGDVLLTISGTPVVLRFGAQPSYRDLGPGISGTDILQLERALERRGFDSGAVDRVYDASTGAPDGLLVASPEQRQPTRAGIRSDLDVLFLMLGGVSLLVGAIGIAKIRLVSVMERVGEIGLRRALGATRRQIGLLAGLYPALRAARLEPVDALRART